MNKFITLLCVSIIFVSTYAQSPQKMSYQAVIRDASDALVSNTTVGIQISILQGSSSGTAVFIERHTPTSNINGLVSLEIGTGTVVTGVFNNIDWSAGPYFIKTETDPSGGTTYSISGTSELTSVPYALFSANGTPGPQGIQGPTGAQGIQGVTGVQGLQGVTGATGPQGLQGIAGNNGTNGAQGPTGSQGIQGATGPQGIQGIQGTTGPQGIQGIAGSNGSQGIQGPTGPQGIQGIQGPQGSQGIQGIQGNAGAIGTTGPQGMQGIQGPQGTQGIQGVAGAVGVTGPQGLQGIQGPQGATGPQGLAGTNGSVGATGPQGLQGVTGLTGPQGPTGAQGIQGATGVQGTTGVAGATGPQGLQGVTGIGVTGATGATGTFQNGTAAGQMLFWNGTAWVNVAPGNEGQILFFTNGVPTWTTTTVPAIGPTDVYNSVTGKVWMDRNLGANVATSGTDQVAYGNCYQWGRGNDGHELRTSGNTSTLSSTDVPGHSNFILNSVAPVDWRSPQNPNLWQYVNAVTNPCPTGYRIPTAAEWDAEIASWSSQDAAGAFASPLKLTVGGMRNPTTGAGAQINVYGFYWSRTTKGTISNALRFNSTMADITDIQRAWGLSVRCIKD